MTVKLGVVFVHEQNVAENCVACNQTARHEHQYQHLTDVVAYATDRHLVAVQEQYVPAYGQRFTHIRVQGWEDLVHHVEQLEHQDVGEVAPHAAGGGLGLLKIGVSIDHDPVLDVDEVDDVEDRCKEGDQTYSPVHVEDEPEREDRAEEVLHHAHTEEEPDEGVDRVGPVLDPSGKKALRMSLEQLVLCL